MSTNENCTPAAINPDNFRTPIRHKRVKDLVGGDGICQSPALKIPASPMMARLGYGTGVGVYLIERSPKPSGEIRSPWAIKRIAQLKKSTKVYSDRLTYEANILRQLSHPNIVGYRAFGSSLNSGPYLAMEKASTALADVIEERLNDCAGEIEVVPFPSEIIEKVILDVANALVYLHDEKRMVHGDLKSPNVLIFGSFEVAKLCDFGVSRKLHPDGTVDGHYVGTEVWNPMEVLYNKRGKKCPVTAKADIYPFGLTVFEMIALRPPHLSSAEEDCEYNSSNSESTDSSINEEPDDFDKALLKYLGTRPLLPNIGFDSSYNTILQFYYCSTEENPDKRPSAKEIAELFNPSSTK